MAEEKKKVSGEVEKATTDAKKSKAAEKVAKAAKGSKASKDAKPNVFVRAGRSIKKFFKDVKGESKKIVWPDGKTVLKSSIVVIVVVAIVAIIVMGIDMGLAKIIELLQGAASSANEVTTTLTEAVTTTLPSTTQAVTDATSTTVAESTTVATTGAEIINIIGSFIG